MHKIFIILILLVFGCSSSIDISYIKSTGWTYNSGYRISDYIRFDTTGIYEIKNDTIYKQNEPAAIIKRVNKRHFDLEIKSIESGEIGHYMDDREAFE